MTEEKTVDFGPLRNLMEDPSVSEIMVNGTRGIFVEKNGKKANADCHFDSEEQLIKFIHALYDSAGKRIDIDMPYADMCMSDGTRVNAIIRPLSRFGPAVTFRKFSKEINSLEDLIKKETISAKAAALLAACIKGKLNIIFSGGTGTGKTTLLQLLSQNFPEEERVVTIEDAAELRLKQGNVISLEARLPDREGKGEVTIRDLLRNSLRMSPDRIVVGEARGAEAIDMLQAMATGHSGTLSVIHGNSPRDVISRMETMVLMSGVKLPLWDIRKLIASTVNLIVHLERLSDGSRRVTYITEIRGIEKEEIVFNDLFVFHQGKTGEDGKITGELKSSIRYFPLFFRKFKEEGIIDEKIFS